jgi:hypothetical protein
MELKVALMLVTFHIAPGARNLLCNQRGQGLFGSGEDSGELDVRYTGCITAPPSTERFVTGDRDG